MKYDKGQRRFFFPSRNFFPRLLYERARVHRAPTAQTTSTNDLRCVCVQCGRGGFAGSCTQHSREYIIQRIYFFGNWFTKYPHPSCTARAGYTISKTNYRAPILSRSSGSKATFRPAIVKIIRPRARVDAAPVVVEK